MCCVAVSWPHYVRDLLVRKTIPSSLRFFMVAPGFLGGTADQLTVLAHYYMSEVELGIRFCRFGTLVIAW